MVRKMKGRFVFQTKLESELETGSGTVRPACPPYSDSQVITGLAGRAVLCAPTGVLKGSSYRKLSSVVLRGDDGAPYQPIPFGNVFCESV